MVQVIQQEPSLAGRIGKGFGKGLAEQVPQEIKNYRLSQGLERLNQQGGNLNSIQQMQHLLSSGATSEDVQQLLPLIQQAQARQGYQQRIAQGQQSAPSQAASQKPLAGQVSLPSAKTEGGFVSPDEITRYKKSLLQVPDIRQIENLGQQYLAQGITQNPEEAKNLAKAELAQNKLAQDEKIKSFQNDFNKRFGLDTQGKGLADYKDISGEIQRGLLDQGEYLMNVEGLTPEEASERMSTIAIDLAKASNNLRDTSSFWNKFRKSSTKVNELRSQKKDFEKYGFGEQFDDMVVGEMGITPLQAAHVLDPLKNKVLEKKLSDLQTHKSAIPFDAQKKKLKDDKLDEIIKSISPKDNLFAIEYELRAKGYDIDQFKERISRLEQDKEIALTPQQKRQQKRAVSESYLGDLLFQTL